MYEDMENLIGINAITDHYFEKYCKIFNVKRTRVRKDTYTRKKKVDLSDQR